MRLFIAFAACSPRPGTYPRAADRRLRPVRERPLLRGPAVSAVALALAACTQAPPPARTAVAEVTVGDGTAAEVTVGGGIPNGVTTTPPTTPAPPGPPPYVTEEQVPESPSGFALAQDL